MSPSEEVSESLEPSGPDYEKSSILKQQLFKYSRYSNTLTPVDLYKVKFSPSYLNIL